MLCEMLFFSFLFPCTMKIFVAASSLAAVLAEDCSSGDAYCMSGTGPESYCKYWLDEPVCQGSDSPCSCDGPPEGCYYGDMFCMAETGPESYCKYWLDVPVCQGSDEPCSCDYEDRRLAAVEEDESCPSGDAFCQDMTGSSYCKFYQDGPGGRVCQGTDVPCTCDGCSSGDAYCMADAGPASYCKYWLDVPVCQFSDSPCSC